MVFYIMIIQYQYNMVTLSVKTACVFAITVGAKFIYSQW